MTLGFWDCEGCARVIDAPNELWAHCRECVGLFGPECLAQLENAGPDTWAACYACVNALDTSDGSLVG